MHDLLRRSIREGATVATGGPDAPGLPERGYYVAPTVLTSMFPASQVSVRTNAFGLTERERWVLTELVRGRSNREIASALYIGQETVKTHLHHIYVKLDVHGRREAVGRAFELGLVS